jgi:hypothetical protein
MTFHAHEVTPTLRIFSVEKAREFYVDYMGCRIDWEHRRKTRRRLGGTTAAVPLRHTSLNHPNLS